MSSMPSPPSSSGTDSAVRPCSAILRRSSGERPSSVPQISRSISGDASVIRKRLIASRKASWSSVKVKSMSASSGFRQTEHALGNDVALDLVGTGVDRPGLGKQEALQPVTMVHRLRRVAGELAIGAEDAHGGFVHLQVQFRPDDLVDAGLGTDFGALLHQPDRVIGGVSVGFGTHPAFDHRITHARIALGNLGVGLIQLHQPAGSLLEAGRGTQQQTTLETGSGHGHVPALALGAEQVAHRHADVVEEDFGKGVLAIERLDRADGYAGGVQRYQQVAQAVVTAALGVSAEQAEDPVGKGGPGGPGFLAVDDELVAVAYRLAADRCHVGAGARLGPALGPHVLT